MGELDRPDRVLPRRLNLQNHVRTPRVCKWFPLVAFDRDLHTLSLVRYGEVVRGGAHPSCTSRFLQVFDRTHMSRPVNSRVNGEVLPHECASKWLE